MIGIVATDFDGTLLTSDGMISDMDLSTLVRTKKNGHINVIATGRSMYSISKAIPSDTPVDYIVFSSGAGVYDWKNKNLLLAQNMQSHEVEFAFETLLKYDIDFSIQKKIPENHKYVFIKKQNSNPDFERRNHLYTNHSREINPDSFVAQEACQLLAITSGKTGIKLCEELSKTLNELKIIRSTSPMDHQSVWIELFTKNVSKAFGVNQIALRHGIDCKNVMAIGNDYNDLDLLNWAGKPFVVENSPKDIKQDFEVVASNNNSGFSEAVNNWLKTIND